MDNKELIELLEKEMLANVDSIDISAENADKITYDQVKVWYFESEKLIRVLANILSAPMTQAINQLRYAGHHLLKAQTSPKTSQENLNEAFKHCKRAVYDSLDFYVYALNERYSVIMPILDAQNANKLEGLLGSHIKEINQCRVECASRIDYYTGIQKTLVKGLMLIEEINIIQRETGVAKDLLTNKKSLIDENIRLTQYIDTIQANNDMLENALSEKLNSFSFYMALVLSFSVIVGLMVANATITTTHEVKWIDNSLTQ